MPSGGRTSVGQRVCNAPLLYLFHYPFTTTPREWVFVCVPRVYYFHLIFAGVFLLLIFFFCLPLEPFGPVHSIYVPLGPDRSSPNGKSSQLDRKIRKKTKSLSRKKTRAKKGNVESCLYNKRCGKMLFKLTWLGWGEVRMTRQVDRNVLPGW